MMSSIGLAITTLILTMTLDGCLQKGKLLASPSGAKPAAARHNDEGVTAYTQGQLVAAKQHFEAAIAASPTLAEAHYNLGMVLHKMGNETEARPHFMKAADLAPGNEVIWSSPALEGVSAGAPSAGSGGSADGHGHSHSH